jgi:tRNA dimethylallyltransferase
MTALYQINMVMSNKQKIIVIVGPTASGKSTLGIELAKWMVSAQGGPTPWKGAEIISADSRQVYRGLDIGTGKEKFPQHLIDVADTSEDYNVSHFVRDAKKTIEEITARGNLPIIVGGTGFWIDSLIFGYELPEVKPSKKLRDELETKTAGELFAQLQKLDLQRSKHIDKHNKRRLMRAIEIVTATKKPVSPIFVDRTGKGQYDTLWIGLRVPKEELNQRIQQRLNQWFGQGLIEETKRIPHAERFGLAYAVIAKYLKDEIEESQMRADSLRSIIQYAKRQMTWFKRNTAIHWIAVGDGAEKLVREWLL